MTKTRDLTIGPVLFNWTPERWRDFYFRMADEAPADAVYVGETVCSKRAPFFAPHFEAVIERLRGGGKDVIISLLAQVMSKIDRRLVLDLAGMEGVVVEVNDAAALALVSGKPHTVGPFFNVYNEDTLCFLAHRGADVFCLPPELPKEAIAVLSDAAAKHDVQVEVQVFGRIPLALSARCYHARAHGLTKDGCQFVCDRDPAGMTLNTWDGKPFLVINGIQTMSHSCLNLLHEIKTLAGLGVSRFRISPDSHDMVQTARVFRDVLDSHLNADEACAKLAADRPGVEFSNGFFHKLAGNTWSTASA
jgi:collagenase-like PrtC family protease